MASINPDRAAIEELAAAPDDGPIVMINLLRFHDTAVYPPDTDHEPSSGQEAYRRYGVIAFAEVAAVGGHVRWAGEVAQTVIGPDGERWDQAILVEYPSIAALLTMLGRESYQAGVVHRTAALADSRLIRTNTADPTN